MAVYGDLLSDQMSCTLLGNTTSRGGGSWIATGPCGSPPKFSAEELPLLTGMSESLIAQYLGLLEEHGLWQRADQEVNQSAAL